RLVFSTARSTRSSSISSRRRHVAGLVVVHVEKGACVRLAGLAEQLLGAVLLALGEGFSAELLIGERVAAVASGRERAGCFGEAELKVAKAGLLAAHGLQARVAIVEVEGGGGGGWREGCGCE